MEFCRQEAVGAQEEGRPPRRWEAWEKASPRGEVVVMEPTGWKGENLRQLRFLAALCLDLSKVV